MKEAFAIFRIKNLLKELFVFGMKQVRACVFAGSFFALLFLSHRIPLFGLPRYDFLFLGAILIQIILVLTKLETKDEVKVIFLFHIIGFILELFKTQPWIGSWSYPEDGYLKIGTVPLYSGFMYAAIGSYMSQAWKIMKLRLIHHPPYWQSVTVCVFIYANFFTHHFIPDMRWILALVAVIIFWKTRVYYTVLEKERSMPILVSFVLMAFFIWVAENIGSYLGAWKYPDQLVTWSMVSFHKISSWSLLVIISFILIADLKHLKAQRNRIFEKV